MDEAVPARAKNCFSVSTFVVTTSVVIPSPVCSNDFSRCPRYLAPAK